MHTKTHERVGFAFLAFFFSFFCILGVVFLYVVGYYAQQAKNTKDIYVSKTWKLEDYVSYISSFAGDFAFKFDRLMSNIKDWKNCITCKVLQFPFL